MEKILEQIDGIIENAFHLPKSDATDMLLSDLQDLREMVASQQNAHLTPESLATSQTVVNASALEQSDGDTPPAQAQVTQTVSLRLQKE